MIIKAFNNLNVICDKKLELILAIQAVYIKNFPDKSEELDYVEIPPIPYLNELEQIIKICDIKQLINDILKFEDESIFVQIALSLNDNYEINNEKINFDDLTKYLGGVDINKFARNFKSYAEKINWDNFFDNHKNFFIQLLSKFCDFPSNLNLNDIEIFYGCKLKSFNYIPSILMNGGFSYHDKNKNIFYIRGIEWSKEENKFVYDKKYLLECLFHEYSHVIVNNLVDKYIFLFSDLDNFFAEAIYNNLPQTYNNKKILLYEYFVRANAFILTKKYYDTVIKSWIVEHGFTYLEDIINFTILNKKNYQNYEEFFVNELIPYVNNIKLKK